MTVFSRIVFAAICWLLGMLGAFGAYAEASVGYYRTALFAFAFGVVFIALGSILFYEAVRLIANPNIPFIDIDTRLEKAIQAVIERYRLGPIAQPLLVFVPITTFYVLDHSSGHQSLPFFAAVVSLLLIIVALEVLRLWRTQRATPPSGPSSE